MNASALVLSDPPRKKDDCRFHSQLLQAGTPKQLEAIVAEAIEVLELDGFCFRPVGISEPNEVSNWPAAFRAKYHQHRADDLLNQHAETQVSAIFLSTIADYVEASPVHLPSNEQFLQLCAAGREFGWLDGYNIPYTTPMGVNCLFSVSKLGMEPKPFRTLVEACEPMLYLLGDILTNIAISRFSSFFFGAKAFRSKIRITDRQQQLLNVLAKENMTLGGAADMLHISLDTANKHIAAVKTALGAKTQASAVYRGLVAGLVDIDPSEWR